MKKIKKIIKNNITLVIGIIIGVAITGGMAVYAASVAASSVTYTSNSQSNVQGALDTLYTRVNAKISRDMVCPGCVYRKSTTTKYDSNASGANGTNNKLTSNEYKTDYKKLNSNYFLGHVIDSNGYILSSYACGIYNGIFFCLRGSGSNQTSLTYKPFYQEAVNRMKKALPSFSVNTSNYSTLLYLTGSTFNVNAYTNGTVSVTFNGNNCHANYDGTSGCTG